jgi:D-alanyl-D-alanine endopeptidase (penicillin-binding protein 7)
MPEARPGRVSSQRILRILAAAFFATAFLLSAAHAATSKKEVASKKQASSAKSKTVVKSDKEPAVTKSARGGRNVVATYSKRGGKSVVAVQRRSVVRLAEPARPSFGQMAGLHGTDDVLDLKSKPCCPSLRSPSS